MRTGMRCCILTKFPAELSVGTNEVLGTRGAGYGCDCSRELFVTDCIYGDGNLLSYMQVFHLSFLIVGDNPFLSIGQDISNGLSGCDATRLPPVPGVPICHRR